MSNYYGYSQIGLDVKPRRRRRIRRNNPTRSFKWWLPVTIAVSTLGLFILAGAR